MDKTTLLCPVSDTGMYYAMIGHIVESATIAGFMAVFIGAIAYGIYRISKLN